MQRKPDACNWSAKWICSELRFTRSQVYRCCTIYKLPISQHPRQYRLRPRSALLLRPSLSKMTPIPRSFICRYEDGATTMSNLGPYRVRPPFTVQGEFIETPFET